MPGSIAHRGAAVLVLLALATSDCSSLNRMVVGAPPEGQLGHVGGFYGAVAADEARAALTGRDVLSGGGNAADAAVAVGFALAVTLPSRASLGGGGACLVYLPGHEGINPQAILFPPLAPAAPGASDRPAAVPMLARGLDALHARYGHMPIEALINPAEQLARFGVPVSRALARDLGVVGMPLLADPGVRTVFAPNGVLLSEGALITQPDLGATFAQLHDAGIADLYQGGLAQRLAASAAPVGGRFTIADLAGAEARAEPPVTLADGGNMVGFLPPPADGGLAAAAAFRVLQGDAAALPAAEARSIAVAAAWRSGGKTPEALLDAAVPPATLPPLPASTSFVVVDRRGMAVACVLTMDNLFGTGRIASGTGMLLAASPAAVPLPLLAAGIAWSPKRRALRAAAAGSGQEAAAIALADGLFEALRQSGKKAKPMPRQAPEPGRLNIVSCPGYLPGNADSCKWATDPRGTGAAYGGSEE